MRARSGGVWTKSVKSRLAEAALPSETWTVKVFGVGKKGNYLLYLETTVDDYNAHKADYNKWYESIRLD